MIIGTVKGTDVTLEVTGATLADKLTDCAILSATMISEIIKPLEYTEEQERIMLEEIFANIKHIYYARKE